MRNRLSRGWAPTVGMVAALALTGCSLGAAKPAPLPPDRVYAIAKPAMVLIQVDYSAKINYPKLAISKDKDSIIVAKLIALARSGKLNASDNAAINNAYEREVLSNPGLYFSPSADIVTERPQVQVMGSGFMASREGFIATSAHVVATPDEQVKQDFSDRIVADLRDPANQAQIGKADKIPDDLLPGYVAFLTSWVSQHATITEFDKQIHVAIGKGTPGLPLKTNGLAATVAAAGEPVPGKDVAILKIDKRADYATLPVGDENTVKGGETVSVVGYPGDAILKNQDTNPREVSASESHGGLNYARKVQSGYEAIGAKADASPGESGGPVIDRFGRVVGITAYTTLDRNGKTVPNETYAVPARVLKEYLKKARVHAAMTDTTASYEAGLSEFSQQHFRNALEDFRAVKKAWAGHPFVQQYIGDSEHAMVEDGTSPVSPQTRSSWWSPAWYSWRCSSRAWCGGSSGGGAGSGGGVAPAAAEPVSASVAQPISSKPSRRANTKAATVAAAKVRKPAARTAPKAPSTPRTRRPKPPAATE
ncbi:MAG: trypsin-like peptidase domain-containing protein [Candidatus Dormibacteria bacterium]